MLKKALGIKKVEYCLNIKCAKELNEMRPFLDKYRNDILKISIDKKLDDNQRIEKYIKKMKDLFSINTKSKLADCQLKKCFKETREMINNNINIILYMYKNNTKHPYYLAATKYKKIFKNNFNKDSIIQHDLEFFELILRNK